MTTNALDMAFALLREDRPVEAHELMVREVQAVEAQYGRGGPEWASAQCDLGHVLLNAGQPDGAAECYRNACSGPPPADPEAHKDHLTYRLNLGTALRVAGRLEEAEAELRRNAEERLAFYGEGHPGHAFGLQPLAEVLLERGDLVQARQVVEQTVAVFWNSGHPQVADALALRAQVAAAEGVTHGLFESLRQLPDDMVEQVAAAALNRAGNTRPEVARPVVMDLVSALEARLGEDHQSTLNALSVMANLGRAVGDAQGRVAAIRRVLSAYDRQGRAEDALMAAQGLAIAHSEAGEHEASLNAYADALGRAERLDRPELVSQTLRNWGLALAELDRHGEAEQRLREAVA